MNIILIGAGPNSLGEHIAKELESYSRVYIFDKQLGDDAADEVFADRLLIELYKRQPVLVVNFVGAIDFQMLKDLDLKRFKHIWDINLLPLVNISTALAKFEGSTSFIQIGSNAASYPFTGMFSYSVSKYAQKQAIRILAKEIAPRSRANMINPGPMQPQLSMMSKDQIPLIFGDTPEEEAVERMKQRIPMKRLTDIPDLINAIKFLNANTFMTGQVVELSGGQIL